MSRSRTVTDHDEIRRWAEERGGKPSAVKRTRRGAKDVGMIRIDFPGYSGEGSLEPITWDQWFDKFDQKKLALILQDETSGGAKSNFNKLVARKTAAGRARRPHRRPAARKPAAKRAAKGHSTRRTTAKRGTASRPGRTTARRTTSSRARKSAR